VYLICSVENFVAVCRNSVENLQLSVGKLQLPFPLTFSTHDAAGSVYVL